MTPREKAVVEELEAQRAVLATRAATLAGELAETKAALDAALAEVEAQRIRADDAETRAERAATVSITEEA